MKLIDKQPIQTFPGCLLCSWRAGEGQANATSLYACCQGPTTTDLRNPSKEARMPCGKWTEPWGERKQRSKACRKAFRRTGFRGGFESSSHSSSQIKLSSLSQSAGITDMLHSKLLRRKSSVWWCPCIISSGGDSYTEDVHSNRRISDEKKEDGQRMPRQGWVMLCSRKRWGGVRAIRLQLTIILTARVLKSLQ